MLRDCHCKTQSLDDCPGRAFLFRGWFSLQTPSKSNRLFCLLFVQASFVLSTSRTVSVVFLFNALHNIFIPSVSIRFSFHHFFFVNTINHSLLIHYLSDSIQSNSYLLPVLHTVLLLHLSQLSFLYISFFKAGLSLSFTFFVHH